jgi:pimeloyl-ACP methyl ester carboxylesterase
MTEVISALFKMLIPEEFTVDFIFSSDGCTWLTMTSVLAFVVYTTIIPPPNREEVMAEKRETWTEEARIADAADRAEKVAEGKATTEHALQAAKLGKATNVPGAKTRSGPPTQRKTVSVKTVCGPVSVTVIGNPDSNNKVLTFHDLGLNHRYCFSTFFRSVAELDERKEGSILSQFCVYHIDAPGHDEEANDIDVELTMDGLNESIHQVVEELNIRSFVGLGVGAGATLLMRYAVQHPGSVRALMLIGPSGDAASNSEKDNYTWISRLLGWYGMSPYAKKGLTGLHFSTGSISRNVPMVQDYQDALDSFNCKNIGKFVDAYHHRQAITDGELKKLITSIPLLITAANGAGGGIPLMNGVDRVAACEKLAKRVEKIDSTRVTWWEIDKLKSGHLVTEERPQELHTQIGFFLKGLGFVR